jgi:hypothetical protein
MGKVSVPYGKPQHLVPLVADQAGVDRVGQQLRRVRERRRQVAARPEPVQGDRAKVANPRREHQPGQLEQRKHRERLACSVGGVLGKSVALPKISSSTYTASRSVTGMIFVPYMEC